MYSDSLACPDFTSSPNGVSELDFLRFKTNVDTDSAFDTLCRKNGWAFEGAVKLVMAILIRVQCQGRATWVSEAFESNHLAAIVSGWPWSDFVPSITSEIAATCLSEVAQSAWRLCRVSDDEWMSVAEVANWWTRLSATFSGKILSFFC